MKLEDVLERVGAYGCRLVEVTGGEPLAQRSAFELISRLCDQGYEVLIETGGYVSTAEVDERAKIILDVKCPASGEAERNHWPNLVRLRADKDEVKFVVTDRNDFDYMLDIVRRYDLVNNSRAVLVSPVWGATDLEQLAEWIKESGLDLRMQLQLHKYVWGAEVHGV